MVGQGSDMLIKVNAGKGQTHVNIDLQDVAEVVVGNKPGVRYVRGAHSSITLKDGKHYLIPVEEADRVVEAMRKLDDEQLMK